jgi:hypothetical protein
MKYFISRPHHAGQSFQILLRLPAQNVHPRLQEPGSHAFWTISEQTNHLRIQEYLDIDHAGLARWLLHEADYGVTATHSSMRPGWPFGNVLSISDGPKGNSTGRLLFYVATNSVFVADVNKDARATVTVTEEQTRQGCWLEDPEWPMCARVRLPLSTKPAAT